MMINVKKIFEKHKEIIIYIIVGIATTIVSWMACYLAKLFLNSDIQVQNFLINTVGWATGVLFAYPLNRKFVFHSHNSKKLQEFTYFATSRVSTWILDVLIMWLFVNIWSLESIIEKILNQLGKNYSPAEISVINYWFAKIAISSVLVTIANYLLSKYTVFSKKNTAKDNGKEI